MTEAQIEQIIKNYIKNNLNIEINAERPDSYEEGGSKYVAITVKLILDGEHIGDDRVSFRLND